MSRVQDCSKRWCFSRRRGPKLVTVVLGKLTLKPSFRSTYLDGELGVCREPLESGALCDQVCVRPAILLRPCADRLLLAGCGQTPIPFT